MTTFAKLELCMQIHYCSEKVLRDKVSDTLPTYMY